MMSIVNNKTIKGSALLTSLIFAFVLMVIISSLAYNFQISKSSIDSLVDDRVNTSVDNGYLEDLFVSASVDQTVDNTVGDFRFLTTVNSITPAFYPKNTNVALYQAEPYIMSHNLTHSFINDGVTEYVKNIIFNSLPNDTMTQYSPDIYPINVPFVNIDGMSGDLATDKLSSGSSILDSERGFIGTISKNGSNLDIIASGTSKTVGVPGDLSLADYKFNIGWNLKDGLWSVFLAAYDTSKVYTSSTSLRNLVDNSTTQAQTDLNNWKNVASLPSGSSIPSGSVILTKWMHDADDEVPKPVILRKQESADTPGNFLLAIYDTTYNSGTGVYTAGTATTTTETTDDFDVTKVFMVIPDNAFILYKLDAKRPLIFYKDGSVTKVVQFNLHGAGSILVLGDLNPIVDSEPILVRKNATQSYLVYHNDVAGFWGTYYFYTHVYSAGVLNTTAITPIQSVTGAIQKLIPKFGVLFVVTSSNIYIDSFDDGNDPLLNRIPIASGNYQILRDDDGKIYATSDDSATKHYIRTEGSCSTNGCTTIDELNNIAPYLGLVYRNDEH